MYYTRPFFSKGKHYYEKEAELNKNTIIDLSKQLSDDRPSSEITETLALLKRKTSIFINHFDYNGCAPLISIIEIMNEKIINLKNQIPEKKFTVDAFNTSINTSLNMQYVLYIQKYGIPDDGIFLEELLNEFA